jgi:hypothetical protein
VQWGPVRDMQRPLAGLDLSSELSEMSCTDYAAAFGVGNGNCDVDTIRASEVCQADEACQANPGFIQTRCPETCGTGHESPDNKAVWHPSTLAPGEISCDELYNVLIEHPLYGHIHESDDLCGKTVRALPGRSSGLRVFHSRYILYGVLVWVHMALNSRKRRFSARAVG